MIKLEAKYKGNLKPLDTNLSLLTDTLNAAIGTMETALQEKITNIGDQLFQQTQVTATESRLGNVKIGRGISVTDDGIIAIDINTIETVVQQYCSGIGIAKTGYYQINQEVPDGQTKWFNIDISELGFSSKDDYELLLTPTLNAPGDYGFPYPIVFFNRNGSNHQRASFGVSARGGKVKSSFVIQYTVLAKGYGSSIPGEGTEYTLSWNLATKSLVLTNGTTLQTAELTGVAMLSDIAGVAQFSVQNNATKVVINFPFWNMSSVVLQKTAVGMDVHMQDDEYNYDSISLAGKAYVDEKVAGKADTSDLGNIANLTTMDKTSAVAAINEVKTVVDSLGSAIQLYDFSLTGMWSLPTLNSDTAEAKIDIVLPTDMEDAYKIGSLAKFELYDNTSGGNRIAAVPLYMFGMNQQKTLRVGFACKGTTSQTVKRIQGTMLLTSKAIS